MPLAHLAYRRVVRRQTEQVDGHDDPGCEVRPVLDEPHRLLEFGGIEVERTLVHVDEHRHRTEQRGSFASPSTWRNLFLDIGEPSSNCTSSSTTNSSAFAILSR